MICSQGTPNHSPPPRHLPQQTLIRAHNRQLADLRASHEAETGRLQGELKATRRRAEEAEEEGERRRREGESLKTTIATQSAASLQTTADLHLARSQLSSTETLLSARVADVARLETLLADALAKVEDLEKRLREEETVRRKLHNTVQELRGNIRVFCRVRPVGGSEDATTAVISYPQGEEGGIELVQSFDSADGLKITTKSYPFTFDRVFQPGTSQEQIFGEISQLVQSALDGYNVCVFAYGQTGSGKTYTMEGPIDGDPTSMGMIPRAVHQVFDEAARLSGKGWTYTMETQFVEIYNETVRDLLATSASGAALSEKEKKHEIRHDPKTGKTSVDGVNVVKVASRRDVGDVLRRAAGNRAVGATNMNERSSRSHSVFTLRLTGHNPLTDESSEGLLNLIDLAGSERLAQSGSTGDRLKETQNINRSLSCLGDVIMALANRDGHVPYRNSKLTYLLQNSLGGNSKTLMFVNVSPLPSNFSETLNSLRFATKVNSVNIGTATNANNKK
ncbi:kinesin-domain-containing protein [Gonapodya prolifera JEL478]|uniref:Kinesin-domain-containing protein n=1 Tax=Gonapodya prolifera (strain JEL478) TaxID=1344416 RepID=A0A139AD47_GONPJ|nr:kinesin-domain-containing protein [Gonapodya prolifera JEL478]|eukprot:KXS14690.1 kinesin-domain-containing protein [Gonapodya prolifera JEL478]